MQLNVHQQNHLNGFHGSFFSNIKSSYSLFIWGREVDQEVQLVQVYF